MTTKTQAPAMYTRLRSGEWGLRIRRNGAVRAAGDTVYVSRRDGTEKAETIGRILWTGDDAILATIARGRTSTRRDYGYRSGAGLAAPVAGYSSYCTDRPDCRCFDCAS